MIVHRKSRLNQPSGVMPVLPTGIQRLWNWFAFFLAFPVLDLFGLSITFFIFLGIAAKYNSENKKLISVDARNIWFWLFLLSSMISSILHPPLMNDVDVLQTLRGMIQFSYWIILALVVKSSYNLIDWYQISRYIFIGLLMLMFTFYFVPFKLTTFAVNVNFVQSRNGVVFNVLNFLPLIFLHLRSSKLKPYTWLFLVIFVIGTLFSNGRAGFVLIIFQMLLIGSIVSKRFKVFYRIGVTALAMLSLVWIQLENSPFMDRLAQQVETVNPRAASLISKSGNEGDLDMDKSWLLRELMVEKAVEISKVYPVFGIGIFNFTNYDAELSGLHDVERLGGLSRNYYNTRSAHNSYAQHLAEGGYVGLGLLIIILWITLRPAFIKILFGGFVLDDLPLICMLTLSIYFYVISSLTGSGTWFTIGLAYALSTKSRAR